MPPRKRARAVGSDEANGSFTDLPATGGPTFPSVFQDDPQGSGTAPVTPRGLPPTKPRTQSALKIYPITSQTQLAPASQRKKRRSSKESLDEFMDDFIQQHREDAAAAALEEESGTEGVGHSDVDDRDASEDDGAMEDDDDGFIDGESEVDEEDLQFNAKMAAREQAREERRAARAQEYGRSDWASSSSERAEE